MGPAATMLYNAAGNVAGELTKEISYGIGNLTGHNERLRQDQLKQQQALTDIQLNANRTMAEYSQQLQKGMYDYTYARNTPEQMMNLYKEAGLNPAMMYQGSGGVSGTTTGSANAGSVSGGQASDETARNAAAIQQQGMALQIQKLASGIEVNKSIANANNAKATTENAQRDVLVEQIKQAGQEVWLRNLKTDWEMNHPKTSPEDAPTVEMYGNKVYNAASIANNSIYNEQISLGIAKGLAEKGNTEAQGLLTNEKAKGYWNELLNATMHAEADKVKAAAVKLATEWETGEYTNWRTWVKTGVEAINGVVKAAMLIP